MALADSARNALRPTNSIEAVPPPPDRDLQGARPSGSAPGKAAAPYTTEPEAIAKAYYVEDRGRERRYFDDYQRKALAMRATDTSISSKREDLNTVRAMLEIAEPLATTLAVLCGINLFILLGLTASLFGAWLGGVDVMNAGFFSEEGASINDFLNQ